MDELAEPLDEWLAPQIERRTVVIEGRSEPASGGFDRFLDQIEQYDSLDISEQSVHLPALPFESDQFDLVVCAFISSSNEVGSEALDEIGRVLKPGGELLIVDYLVPGSRLRGKKARQLRAAGEYVNSWMHLRNPLHQRFLDQDAWEQLLMDGQWDIKNMATQNAALDFNAWIGCHTPSAKNRLRLQALLIQAPEKVHCFLTPLRSGDRIAFRMTEVFILATKNSVQ